MKVKLSNQISNVIIIIAIFLFFFLEYDTIIEALKTKDSIGFMYTMSRYQLFLVIIDYFGILPLILVFLVVFFIPVYKRYRNNLYIFCIGKDNNYNKYLIKTKRKISLVNCGIISLFLGIYIIISIIYSIIYDKLNEENLSIFFKGRCNLFVVYIVVMIVIYLYTYAILTYSESVSSIPALSILFIISYILLTLATYRFLGDKLYISSFSTLIGTNANPLYLLSNLIYPVVLYIGSMFNKKDITIGG